MAKSKREPRPTIYQANILRQIASSPLMKTYTPDRRVVWGLANGRGVPEKSAATLIRNGWVKPQRDGLSMFDESQTYVVLKP
jgi:hypothetical protein